MKNLFKISLLLILIVSCTKNRQTIILNTENAQGLTTESKLDINGFEIGRIIEMDLTENGTINLICEIENSEFKIPRDSKFYIKNLGLLAGSGIRIELGSEKELIKTGNSIKITN